VVVRPGTKAAIQRAIQAIIRLRDDSTALSPRNEEDQAAIRALTAAERALSWALDREEETEQRTPRPS
jgi:hypothetical protein